MTENAIVRSSPTSWSIERVVAEADIADHREALRAHMSPPGLLASPTLPFVLSHPLADQARQHLAPEGAPAPVPVHLSQEIRLQDSLRAGQRIRTGLQLQGARPGAAGVRAALRAFITREDGGPVAESITTILLSGDTTITTAFGELPPVRPPDSTDSGESPTVLGHRFGREWTGRYARASGDDNPIHLDDGAARAAGFDTAIVHGMGLVGVVCEEVIDRFANGDTSRVCGLGARFAAPVPVDEDVDSVLCPDATRRVVRFSCRTSHRTAVKGGWVELAAARDTKGGQR
ncbi:MaoC/PaaZ C-terminal domain-containing protein [Lipingzhangella rawalii]|uniref:MaoC/PaaZ C-terminal domain-containing protein n=1 Tax=Lipingzhangella rawalii TaxID=2055835 RepID=UPI003898E931